MARRRMDRDTRYRVMEHAAWRRIGHEHAYMIAFGPFVGRLVVLLAAVGALAFLWIKVPHAVLGVVALVAAAVVGGGWLAWTNSYAALQRRMRSGASAQRGVGLGWAVACLVLLFAATGWLSLWSPYA
jgi:hypothetical protein